jgi:para-aminobenzoate synthetase component 1
MIDEMNYYGSRGVPFIFIIDFGINNAIVCPLKEALQNGILFAVRGFSNAPKTTASAISPKLEMRPLSYKKFKDAFDAVMAYETAGDSYLCNLTFPTPIDINLELMDVFYRGVAPYMLLYKNEFVIFSPETFVKINGREISSYPMKGTIDASIPNARGRLIGDEKELAEHITIVDLIRNDLNMVSHDVRVEKFRYIERITSKGRGLLQASSKITGRLDAGYMSSIGDIIRAMLPAGSVTGAPKKRTVEIIEEVEGYDRGFYTGIFGFFDGNTLDSGVMIRFIEYNKGGYVYKSGGGITVYSDPRSEYKELIDKIYVPVV